MKAPQKRINELLKEKKAILLAHNYQVPEVQDIADLCGDSLELSMKASRTDAEVIVFCGVHFMAETASILSPEKKVLLPAADAGCAMAELIDAEKLKRAKRENPDAVVVSYVNTTAEVKALSDICCTSANVVQVVESIDARRKILMLPDKNLAHYAKTRTGRDIRALDGYCPIHDNLTAGRVERVKRDHPEALFLAHPECPPDVLALADEIVSTSGMIAYARKSEHRSFIIGTESGILHALRKANPDKQFIPADPAMVCPDMKKTGLEDILSALEEMAPEVKVPEGVRVRAKKAVERMLAVPRG
ncbi:MAG: quinolinate synthase NadA [Pseudomonadota bacterium]